MATEPIRIPRNSPPAKVIDCVSDYEEDDDGGVPAGVMAYCNGYDGTPDVAILFGCPCGCGALRSVAIKPYSRPNPVWTWDGNRTCPTLTPSILIYQLNDAGERVGEHWHGFLTAGVFQSC